MQAIDLASTEGMRFLSGEKFVDYGKFTVAIQPQLSDRISTIVNLLRGKSILHIGFCDHQPLLKERIRQGLWLHNHLVDVGSRCVGIDIDEAAVANVKKVTDISDIYAADITSPGVEVISQNSWDVAVFADVLEHIPDPASFIQKFLDNYGKNISSIIISVPNAQRLGNFKGALGNFEMINSDHRAEYTIFTLAKLANKAGLIELKFSFCPYANAPLWKRLAFKLFPRLSDSLILSAKVQ